MDLRFTTPLEKTGLGPHEEIMLKGDPFSSWVFLRMVYNDHRMMPGLLTIHPDEKGSHLIRDWVSSLGD